MSLTINIGTRLAAKKLFNTQKMMTRNNQELNIGIYTLVKTKVNKQSCIQMFVIYRKYY